MIQSNWKKLIFWLCACVQTWYVCCAEEARRCVSWWAFRSRFTNRGIAPASLSGAWLAGHSARFRMRPTVAWGEDMDQRHFFIWVSFKGNLTCGASIWQYHLPLELYANHTHCTHVSKLLRCFISKETAGSKGKRCNSFQWMEQSLDIWTPTRAQWGLRATPTTCSENTLPWLLKHDMHSVTFCRNFKRNSISDKRGSKIPLQNVNTLPMQENVKIFSFFGHKPVF